MGTVVGAGRRRIVLLLAAALLGCDGARCEEVVQDGETYCVARWPAVIEGGITCPPELAFELRFERGIICTDSPIDPEDLPPEICAMIGGCEAPAPPTPDAGTDAGTADAAAPDAGPAAGTWRALPDAPHARVSTCASRPGRVAYFGGWEGTPSETVIVTGGAELELSTGSWRVFPEELEPAKRVEAVFIGTDGGWFVFGGDGGFGALAGGAFLADGAPSWRTLPALNAPSGRRWPAAAWTGREVLLWGGAPGPTPVGDGAAFDPSTFTWRPIASEGAPAPRDRAAAAWTGTELVVWGGADRDVALGDGAAYDPATDRWRPIARAGAPSSRAGAFSAWDGERVIVWGGIGRRDGGAYDPVYDAWRAIPRIPSALVPLESVEHFAGLVPGALVVWGPTDSSLRGSAGAIFDLDRWQWLPLELEGEPSPRVAACGASTDHGLAVLLGQTPVEYLRDGALHEGTR